jgi:RNA polymerase sigma-70 factor (ECF subfamily)
MKPETPHNEARLAGQKKQGLLPESMWSTISRARGPDPKESSKALERLCQAYYEPLRICVFLWYVKHRGFSNAQAQTAAPDALHSFFEALLRRKFLDRLDRNKGRFRSFILASLNRFLLDVWAQENAVTRGGGSESVSIDELGEDGQPIIQLASSGLQPDQVVLRAWAHSVLENALKRLEIECIRLNKSVVFEALKPSLEGEGNVSQDSETAKRLHMSLSAVRVARHRLKEVLLQYIRDEVKETVTSEEELSEELSMLAQLLRE